MAPILRLMPLWRVCPNAALGVDIGRAHAANLAASHPRHLLQLHHRSHLRRQMGKRSVYHPVSDWLDRLGFFGSALAESQTGHAFERRQNFRPDELIFDAPLEDSPQSVDGVVDAGTAQLFIDQQLPERLEPQRAEFAYGRAAI